ncbi:MAG: DUF1553 domain-containing protein [Planctomycetota bacterium]|nr:DUF1553 domain-containing protein [Planctomycetota bacterium]MDA1142241.1 DUF1553 domain-containing protein [Planctomycetota bacterium]
MNLNFFLLPACFAFLNTQNIEAAPNPAELAELIDNHMEKVWAQEGLTPSPISKDSEFLRRLFLDVNGSIPPAMEVVEFIKEKSQDKRSRKINELVDGPGFARNMEEIWNLILLGRGEVARGASRAALGSWLRYAFSSNMPYNEFVRELVAATGRGDENGAVNYILGYNLDAKRIAGHSAATFLGRQIRCAECHNHPMEKWKQRDFWGYTAFFTQMNAAREAMGNNRNETATLVDTRSGEAVMEIHNGSKEVVQPKLLDGTAVSGNSSLPRRQVLAKYMSDPQNPYVAKAFVNRTWHLLFGRGIVNPVDDLGESNPPVVPELFEALSKKFAESNFDMKYLTKGILLSKTWQRSSDINESNKDDEDFFSRSLLRMMTPEQLFQSLSQAMGEDTEQRYLDPQRMRQLRDRALSNYVFNFSTDEEDAVVSFQGTIPQALLMMNGETVTEGILSSSNRNMSKFLEKYSGSNRIELLYLASLSRRPTNAEKSDARRLLAAKSDKAEGYEDIFWALLNSTEFIFNH